MLRIGEEVHLLFRGGDGRWLLRLPVTLRHLV